MLRSGLDCRRASRRSIFALLTTNIQTQFSRDTPRRNFSAERVDNASVEPAVAAPGPTLAVECPAVAPASVPEPG